MNAMAWIAIAAIIVPNAMKAYELYLTHKKQATPKPTENQPSAASHNGIKRSDRLLRWLPIAGRISCVLAILSSLYWIVHNFIHAPDSPRIFMAFNVYFMIMIYVTARLLKSF